MSTTKTDIARWIMEGLRQNATHMIVATDTFDWDDYPVYCKTPEECLEKYEYYSQNNNMQRVTEVYDLRGNQDSLKAQLDERRTFRLPEKPE